MSYRSIITEFGQRMGLRRLHLEPGKPVQLYITGMGTLFLEKTDSAVLLYLARSFPQSDRYVPLRALTLCHHSQARPIPVSAGLYKENILFLLTRFTQEEFTVQELEKAVPYLSRMLDDILRS